MISQPRRTEMPTGGGMRHFPPRIRRCECLWSLSISLAEHFEIEEDRVG
jgi:hypothetical protein